MDYDLTTDEGQAAFADALLAQVDEAIKDLDLVDALAAVEYIETEIGGRANGLRDDLRRRAE